MSERAGDETGRGPDDPGQARVPQQGNRSDVKEKDLISAIRDLSGSQPSFPLTEALLRSDAGLTDPEALSLISPLLPALGLTARKNGQVTEIVRISAARYIISAAEAERQAAFFRAGRLPVILEQAIEDYVSKKTGKRWDDPIVTERLRRAIVSQKGGYWKQGHRRSPEYAKGYSVLSYLAYHVPVYFMQSEYLLMMLARQGFLKKTMTILDAGTGPGVVPFAIADFFSRLDNARASVWSIERSEEQAEAFINLRDAFVPPNGRVSVRPPMRLDIRTVEPSSFPPLFDLVVLSNVLNEIDDPGGELRIDIVGRLSERIAPDGVILIIEPADKENAIRMRQLTIRLRKRGLSVLGPCSFLWGSVCTAPRCWSFDVRPPVQPTRLMEHIARCSEPYRYLNTDIKFSYAILGRTTPVAGPLYNSGSGFSRFSRLRLQIGKRINAAGVKMSADLGNERSHVFKLCDGTAKEPVYAVLPSYHITSGNDTIISAPYGTVLEMRKVHVRYNPVHDAYNLLISRNTSIRAAPGRSRSRALPPR